MTPPVGIRHSMRAVESVLEIPHLRLRGVSRQAIGLLDLSDQLVALAVDLRQVVVGELPHFSRTFPEICFQFPSMRSVFIVPSLVLVDGVFAFEAIARAHPRIAVGSANGNAQTLRRFPVPASTARNAKKFA